MKVPVEETPLGKYMVKEFVYTPLNASNMTTAAKMHLVPEETHPINARANYRPFDRAGNSYFYLDDGEPPVNLLGNDFDLGTHVRVSTLQFERPLQMHSVKMTLGSFNGGKTLGCIQFWSGEEWKTCSGELSGTMHTPVEFIMDLGSKSSKWRIWTKAVNGGWRPEIGSVQFFERL